jgi:outer membrane protein assembly factor BamB
MNTSEHRCQANSITSHVSSHRGPNAALCAAILVAAVICATVHAENWPSFRGPQGTGISADKAVPATWSDKENVRWRIALPERGNSTPVVWGERVFVTQAIQKENRRTLMCINRADGKLLWQAGVKYELREPTNAQNPYCSASPATDGQRVVASFSSAGLYCYDFEGKELWHRDLGTADSWHGSGSSPIVYGDLCILNFGPGSNAALVACDLKTGEVVWKVDPPKAAGRGPGGGFGPPRGDPAGGTGGPGASSGSAVSDGFERAGRTPDFSGRGGFRGSWSTPVVVRVGDHDELIVVHPFQITGYEPKTGKELWVCKGLPEQVFTSPAIGDGVLVATGHLVPAGTTVMAVKLGGSGDVTEANRLWQTKLPKECIGSGVITGGFVYLVSENGFLVCLDLKSGEKKWENRLPGTSVAKGSWSSLVLADGKLLAVNHSGETFVLKASSEFEVLATNSISAETTCASLAISDGLVFLRTHQGIWCFGKR